MENKNLIISLILTIIFLLYSILDYLGIIRKWCLRSFSVESYSKKYPSLSKADDKSKVIIAFSSNPNELHDITPFVNSLLNQTVRVDDITLVIPYKDIGKVPEELKAVLSINGHSKNYGTKQGDCLICSVLQEMEAKTKIIIVEPSEIYDKEFVQDIVEESNKNPSEIIKKDKAMLVKPEFFSEKTLEKYKNL